MKYVVVIGDAKSDGRTMNVYLAMKEKVYGDDFDSKPKYKLFEKRIVGEAHKSFDWAHPEEETWTYDSYGSGYQAGAFFKTLGKDFREFVLACEDVKGVDCDG